MMEQLARFITDERTGLKYELCGNYYIIAGEDEPEREPIGGLNKQQSVRV